MRKILLVAAATATLAVACQAAYGQDLTTIRLAQATTTAPAADTAPAAPAPAAAPAAQPAPAAQAQPDATPTTKASKPAKKRVAKRRSWEADEAKARGIAAKYGVTW